MRPKRVILLVDQDEQTLAERRFLLVTYAYRVIAARNTAEALKAYIAPQSIDLVLVNDCPHVVDGAWLVPRLKRARPDVPVLLLVDRAESCPPEAIAVLRECQLADLLEQIRIMSQRKREPRKGARRVVKPEPSTVST